MKIEKNIPMPTKTSLVGMPPSKYGTVMYEDMVTMEIGDSVRLIQSEKQRLHATLWIESKEKGTYQLTLSSNNVLL